MVELLALLEHVLAEQALVHTRGGDRGRVMEDAGAERVRQLDRVPGALDVRDPVRLFVGGHVVYRREVEEVVDVALELRDSLLANPKPGLGQVAQHRPDAWVLAPAVGELLDRALAHQHVDVGFALEQSLDQEASDEAGATGDEVGHLRGGQELPAAAPVGVGRAPFGGVHPGVLSLVEPPLDDREDRHHRYEEQNHEKHRVRDHGVGRLAIPALAARSR
jgi:hypothetical protein